MPRVTLSVVAKYVKKASFQLSKAMEVVKTWLEAGETDTSGAKKLKRSLSKSLVREMMEYLKQKFFHCQRVVDER